MKKIKIAYIISSSEIGGTEKMLLLMLENLDENKFGKPVVITIKGKGKFTEELAKRNIRRYTYNFKKNPFLFFRLLYDLKREHPDIIHSFLFYGNLVGRISGRLLGINLVISSQRSIDGWRKWYHWKIDSLTSVWTDLIISNSFSGKKVLVERARIPEKKIIVIPNGISVRKLECRVSRESLGLNSSVIVIGSIGNLRKAKGHIYLIKAASLILSKFPDTVFLIAGEGNLKQMLVDEAEKRGIREKFVFMGFRPDAEEIIQLFDIFVLPSLWEGFPVSLLEAMKYGKPVVAFGVADVPYIIENGKNGFVVEPGSHEKLASGIGSLLQDKNVRMSMGLCGEKRFKEQFNLEKMIRDYSSAYVDNLKYRLI